MEKTRVHKAFTLSSEYPKILRLSAPHSQHMRYKRQTGGDMFVDYDVYLSPKSAEEAKHQIDVTIKVAKSHELPIVEKGISDAIVKLISDYEEQGIGIEGFDLVIESQLFHPVDSRPFGYKFTLYKILREQLGNI